MLWIFLHIFVHIFVVVCYTPGSKTVGSKMFCLLQILQIHTSSYICTRVRVLVGGF